MNYYEKQQNIKKYADIRGKVEKLYKLMGEPQKPPKKKIYLRYRQVKYEDVYLTTKEMLDLMIAREIEEESLKCILAGSWHSDIYF